MELTTISEIFNHDDRQVNVSKSARSFVLGPRTFVLGPRTFSAKLKDEATRTRAWWNP
jgi:hypothetical protein